MVNVEKAARKDRPDRRDKGAGKAAPIGNIVTVEQLKQYMDRGDVFVADCRFDLADPEAGQRAYVTDHIPGAIYFHLDEDLSVPATGAGGRHPLPAVADFVALFAARGIGDDMTVVCYDDSGGGMAGRLWWMLRYIGHERVALLDGGYSSWVRAGFPVTDVVPSLPAARLTVCLRPDMVATSADVRVLSETGQGVIIDSRAPERYRGEVEPLDPVAGHIPGAVNFPWQDNVDEQSRFLTPTRLQERFSPVSSKETGDIIVHCGSGVTGCVNVLALKQAGRHARLYVGGWSDWCSDPDNPVESGDPEKSAL